MLQSVVVCYNVLHCVAVCCSVSQCRFAEIEMPTALLLRFRTHALFGAYTCCFFRFLSLQALYSYAHHAPSLSLARARSLASFRSLTLPYPPTHTLTH